MTNAMTAIKLYASLNDKAAQKMVVEKIANVATSENVHREFWLLCIGQGYRAKQEGDGTFNVNRLWKTFYSTYYGKDKGKGREPLSPKTEENYRSGFGRAVEAGMKPEWDARETAVKVIDTPKLGNVGARGAILSKFLELDAAPSGAKFKEIAKPKDRSNDRKGTTPKQASASLNRSVVEFGVKWLDQLSPTVQALFAEIAPMVENMAATIAAEAAGEEKPTPKKGEATPKVTFKDKQDTLKAKLAAMQSGGSQKRGARVLQ